MNTYVCSKCKGEFDTNDMPWTCPVCPDGNAIDIFYIGTNIPVIEK